MTLDASQRCNIKYLKEDSVATGHYGQHYENTARHAVIAFLMVINTVVAIILDPITFRLDSVYMRRLERSTVRKNSRSCIAVLLNDARNTKFNRDLRF